MIKQVWWMERGPLRETGASIDPLLNTMHQATLSQSLGRDPFPGSKHPGSERQVLHPRDSLWRHHTISQTSASLLLQPHLPRP